MQILYRIVFLAGLFQSSFSPLNILRGEWLTKLEATTLTSQMLTHARLKHLAKIAQTSEDHVSRIGMGLSLRMGAVPEDWQPYG